jgi:hypothetical protein
MCRNGGYTERGLAADALAAADYGWLSSLISRRVPFDDWPQAFNRTGNDVKVVISLKST